MSKKRSATEVLRWGAIGLACAVVLSVFAATQQWAELRDGPKAMPWAGAWLTQIPGWVLLSPLMALLAWVVPRARRSPTGLAVLRHTLAAVGFGFVFALALIPTRYLFHPAPVRWELFGAPFYKSVPQAGAIGAVVYAVSALVLSHHALRREGHTAADPMPERVWVRTASGCAPLDPERIVWMKAARGGCEIATLDGVVHARQTLAGVAEMLEGCGLVATHRSHMVNPARVTEVTGSASRDGWVRVETGDLVPVGRRRWVELARAGLRPAAKPDGT